MFIRGQLYAHDDIIKELKVGNSGGIRVAKNSADHIARIVLFSTAEQESNPTENPYKDRSENGVLNYTGTGRIGDQNLTGANLRVTQQGHLFFPIYVFSLVTHRKASNSIKKRWRFTGIFKFLDYAPETQVDLIGQDRSTWVFRLLELEINEAHPNVEDAIIPVIAESFTKPEFSARQILKDSCAVLFEDVQRALNRMMTMEPFQFEHFVKETLVASEFREVMVTRKSSDGGIDILARMPIIVWPVETQILQIQVKRWQKPVGRRDVAELRGSLNPRALGVMVTTGNFSRTAITEAERPHLQPISLVNGHQFATVTIRLKLSPSTTLQNV